MHKVLIALVTVGTIVGVLYVLQPEEVTAPLTDDPILSEGNAQSTTTSDTGSTEERTEGRESTSVANTPTSPSPILPMAAFVTYDGEKFIPNKVTIVEGGTVKFMNVSDRPLWVASNNHPNHNLYPVKSATDCAGSSFDQCKSVEKGGAWSFTFTAVGSWEFHNDLNTNDRGRVNVMTKEEYLEKFY